NLTEPNSYSDANNRMTAIASDTTYFLRAMDQWMMNNGVVTVELSNGQKVTLDSIKKMQGDISSKFDLKKGGIQKGVGELQLNSAIGVSSDDMRQRVWLSLFSGFPQIKSAIDGVAYNYNLPTSSGTLWNTGNTTIDPQGFIKKASPIIDINPDGTFTTNDESEGATVTRVAQGEYLIEGVLGFNSDAGWGGVDGGIEIPLDVNKQPLIWVDSKVMEDGS
ncbi:TPA: hypothetical protein ACKRIM_004193, partial [Proteus mirabilis]